MQPPRKRFGQHFLHDPAVIERLVHAIDPREADHFVEIGPGRGALTRRLLASPLASLDAIEIDRDLSARLEVELAGDSRFTLTRADALEIDLEPIARARGSQLRLVGNLPYNLSTPLLFHFIASRAALRDLHVMLQREVVARIAARPGTADYGRLTVMLAPWVSAERLFDIGPGAFQPPPRVWSTVVRLTVLPQPAFAVSAGFAQVVAAAFAHRRKTLRNALRGLLSAPDIESCGLDPGARPETVPPDQFNALGARLAGPPGGPTPAPRRTMRERPSPSEVPSMPVYRRILLATDLSDDSLSVARRAQVLAAALGAELEILHVVEYVPVEPMGETLMPAVQIEEELLTRARKQLQMLAAELGIPLERCSVETGNIKAEIVRGARARHADLIVVASRERHGPSIFLNLTEDTVLHAAPCDVLAIRIGR